MSLEMEARNPALRQRIIESLSALERQRDHCSRELPEAITKLQEASSQRHQLDLIIAGREQMVSTLRSSLANAQAEIDRVEKALRETAGGMN